MNPPPDVMVCLDCGWSEFSIPRAWLSAGWLRAERSQGLPSAAAISAAKVARAAY